MQRHRPKGVTIIGVLDIIGGLFIIFAGIALFVGIPFIASHPETFNLHSNTFAFQLLTSLFGYVLAGGLTALGLADIGIGIGLLKGKPWAWKIAVVLAFISIAVNIISIVVQGNVSGIPGSILGIILDVIVLYYLYRPHVKAYFGKTLESGTSPTNPES